VSNGARKNGTQGGKTHQAPRHHSREGGASGGQHRTQSETEAERYRREVHHVVYVPWGTDRAQDTASDYDEDHANHKPKHHGECDPRRRPNGRSPQPIGSRRRSESGTQKSPKGSKTEREGRECGDSP